jgi:hypothetical protein
MTGDHRALDRLVKMLGMLGSDHAGERAAAALKATQALKDMGWTWEDVVRNLQGGQEPRKGASRVETPAPDDEVVVDAFRRRYGAPKPGAHVDMCERLVEAHRAQLSDWELSFLLSLTAKFKFRELSPAQKDALARIVERFHPSYSYGRSA